VIEELVADQLLPLRLGEPAAVLLRREESRLREVGPVLLVALVAAPYVPHLFVHCRVHLLVGHLHRRIGDRDLIQQLEVDQLLDHLPAERIELRRVGRHWLVLLLHPGIDLLVHLGQQDRPVADDRDDPVRRLIRPLSRKRQSRAPEERGPDGCNNLHPRLRHGRLVPPAESPTGGPPGAGWIAAGALPASAAESAFHFAVASSTARVRPALLTL
jgi:hypothetical protein